MTPSLVSIQPSVLSTITGGASPICTPEQAAAVRVTAAQYATRGQWIGAGVGVAAGVAAGANPGFPGAVGLAAGVYAGHRWGTARGQVQQGCRCPDGTCAQ